MFFVECTLLTSARLLCPRDEAEVAVLLRASDDAVGQALWVVGANQTGGLVVASVAFKTCNSMYVSSAKLTTFFPEHIAQYV